MGDAVARPALGTNGAVVAPNHQATTVGLQILRGGGNAVDAAIATNAALSVVSAHSCGLGGDAFWLIWPGDGGPWRRVAQDSGDAATDVTYRGQTPHGGRGPSFLSKVSMRHR